MVGREGKLLLERVEAVEIVDGRGVLKKTTPTR